MTWSPPIASFNFFEVAGGGHGAAYETEPREKALQWAQYYLMGDVEICEALIEIPDTASDFQKSERDFAFVIDKYFKVQELVEIITNIDKQLIKSVKVFDVYEGENIPSDKKSIALNVTIQSFDKTLNESDLEKLNNLIISTVELKSGAKIRS